MTPPGPDAAPLDGAVEDGNHRYQLGRTWDAGALRLMVVALNPSTADATHDDPTIRRCIGFARRWGFGGVDVVNLYAWRATRPDDLWAAGAPVGPHNDAWIEAVAARADAVWAAWGFQGGREGRDRAVAALLGRPMFCVGTTKAGQPRHPLYVRGDTARRWWDAGGA